MRQLMSAGIVAVVSCATALGIVTLIADPAKAGGTAAAHDVRGERAAQSGRSPLHALGRASQDRSRDGSEPRFRNGTGSNCQVLPSEPWFTTVHLLPACMRSHIRGRPGQADINGNGEIDWVSEVYDSETDVWKVERITRSVVQGQVVFSRASVLDVGLLVNFVAAQDPAAQFNGIEDVAFFDVDMDGDLDVLLNLVVDWDLLPCWVENTGHESAPPRLADINRDGTVNAADLSLLLADWG